MSDRLTDEKVALYVGMGEGVATSCANDDVIALAREVKEYRALRPTCPTCNGKPTGSIRECSNGFGGYYDCCPDCDDGTPDFAAIIAPWQTFTASDGVAGIRIREASELLAARVPALCPTCGGTTVTHNERHEWADIQCPDCPTIGRLLAIGAAVMSDDYRTANDTEHRAFAKYRDYLRAVQL